MFPTAKPSPIQRDHYWTQAKHPEVERQMDQLVQHLQARLQTFFQPQDYCCIAITGGYGRGEGGIRIKAGKEALNNNLDLIWVVPEKRDIQTLQKRFKQQVSVVLSQHHDIDIDCYFIHEKHLKRLPCLVMLYDIVSGHRVIAGPQTYLKQLLNFEAKDILPSDMRNLMVNRATLLLLNRWLIMQFKRQYPQQTELPEPLLQRILKHTMKAIIGYGDALLFAQNDYHWSYVKKDQIMGGHLHFPVPLRNLYTQAIQYRFHPQNTRWQALGLENLRVETLDQWQQELLHYFATWHLDYENWRMQKTRDNWDFYIEDNLRHAISAENAYRGVMLRKLKHFVRNQALTRQVSYRARLGLKVSEPASALSVIFPFVAYTEQTPAFVYEQLLISEACHTEQLIHRYLQCWGSYLDPALLSKMKQWQEKVV